MRRVPMRNLMADEAIQYNAGSAMNPRQGIREAAAAALKDRTRAQARAFSNRPNALSQTPSTLPGDARELPAIIIYTRSTRSEVFDESPRRYRHVAEMVAECADEIVAGQEIDDQLDTFEEEALDALLLDDMLGGTADDLQWSGSTMTAQGDGARACWARGVDVRSDLLHPCAGGGHAGAGTTAARAHRVQPGQRTSRRARPRADGHHGAGSMRLA
jgi:hypothetical protein